MHNMVLAGFSFVKARPLPCGLEKRTHRFGRVRDRRRVPRQSRHFRTGPASM